MAPLRTVLLTKFDCVNQCLLKMALEQADEGAGKPIIKPSLLAHRPGDITVWGGDH